MGPDQAVIPKQQIPAMDARFQWPRCRKIGVCPLGAQVRRTGGRSEQPDSSRKQIQAPRLSAPP